MSIRKIITDSLIYPFSNWMRFLFLGIIVLISFSPFTVSLLIKLNFMLFLSLAILGLVVVGSLVSGYLFKIVSESLDGVNELPEFKDWNKMFINGIKVFIVNFIYLIPVILIIISLLLISGSDFRIVLTSLSNFNLELWSSAGFPLFIPLLIALLYLIMIIPVILMSVANMAYNNGKLSEAFKFQEILINISKLSWDRYTAIDLATWGRLIPIVIGFFIFDEIYERIYSIGWAKLIIWYITTGVLFLSISLIGYFTINITSILILNCLELYSLANYFILQIIILSLLLIPYLLIFLSRSTALIYNSAIKSYLIQENNKRNYQLNQYE
jgi:hypothetical protein